MTDGLVLTGVLLDDTGVIGALWLGDAGVACASSALVGIAWASSAIVGVSRVESRLTLDARERAGMVGAKVAPFSSSISFNSSRLICRSRSFSASSDKRRYTGLVS